MSKGFRYFLCAFTLLVLIGGFFLWRFSISAQNTLEASIRQYEQVQTKLERYKALEKNKFSGADGNKDLFASVNIIASQCGANSRLENLRPGGKEDESLDFLLRSLYLGETMRFISELESLERVEIERLVMRRSQNNLLELEMRIKRQNEGK